MKFRIEVGKDFVDLFDQDEICVASVYKNSDGRWLPTGLDPLNWHGMGFRNPKSALAYTLSNKDIDFWYARIGDNA